jgi:hypothetical protein
MQMVTHQHIRMYIHLLGAAVFEQQIEHALVVRVAAKNILSVVSPQDDVVRVAGDGKTRKASHLPMVIRT